MEIFGVARRDLSRTVIVAAGALVAALLAAFLAGGQTRYEVKASVFVSQALPPDAAAGSLGTFLGDFESAASLDTVKKSAADSVGRPAGAFSVAVDRALDASTVSLTVTVPDTAAAEAETFTRALAVGALKLLGQQRLEQAVAAEKTAHDAATKANDALNKFIADNDTLDPVAESAGLTVTLRSLISQKDASGLSDVAKAALDDRIQQTQAEIDRLEPLRSEFAQLQRAATQSQKLADDLAARRITAETSVDTAVSSTLVATGPAEKVSKLAARAQAGFVGLIVGALIALLVLGAERRLRAGRRTQRPAARPASRARDETPAVRTAGRRSVGEQSRPKDTPANAGDGAVEQTVPATRAADAALEGGSAIAAVGDEQGTERDEMADLTVVVVGNGEQGDTSPAPAGAAGGGTRRARGSDAGRIGKQDSPTADGRANDARRSPARPARKGAAKRGGGIRPSPIEWPPTRG